MFEFIKNNIFKAPPSKSDAAPTTKDAAWSESSLYRGADFPKYNPDALIGRLGFSVYQKMMTDEQVKAVVRFKRDAITSRDYFFECAHDELSETDQELRIKIFEHAIKRMKGTITDALNGVLSAMYNGYSLTEKLYHPIEYDGKTWAGIKSLRLRPADTFFFHVDEYGNIEKLAQKLNAKEQDLDVTQFIHYVQNPDCDEHYGRSELRECYRAWFSKDMIIKFQNIHLERFASGFIWVQPKDGKTLISGSQEETQIRSVLSNIQSKTAILLPSMIDLNIEHPATTDAFERAVAQQDKAIAKALLVPNLLGITEQGNTGSYAQSETQLEAFLWTLDADAKRLEDAINEQLFTELGDYNFGDGLYPTFKFKPVSNRQQMEMIKTWTSLVTGKAVQATDTDEAHLREMLEFPEKGEPLVAPVDPNAPKLGPDGKPIVDPETEVPVDPKTGKPMEPKQMEETIVGKTGIKVSAFSRAMKRVDFAVIGNKADNASKDTAYELAALNGAAVARLVALAEEFKLGTAEGRPEDMQKIQYNAAEMSALKAVAAKGLKEAWNIGESHARREIRKAQGAAFGTEDNKAYKITPKEFAVNDLALQDVAAAYLKQKAYTLAGDISAATQKTIRNILMEGIKVSKTHDETKKAIYKALESDGMLTEEDVREALGTTTVKSTNARIETAIRTTSFEAINEARYSFFSEPELAGFVEALEYSAVLDDRTTEICSQLDGETYGIDDEVWSTFRPPNHFNCRSILIPVTVRDTWASSDEPTVMPQKGFGFSRCDHGGHGQ